MDVSELTELREALVTARDFLVKVTLHKVDLAIAGPNELAGWDGYDDAARAMGLIELRLAQAVALSKDVAPDLQDKFKSFSEKSPLALRAAEMAVEVRIAQSRKVGGSTIVLTRKVATALSYVVGGGFVKKLFSRQEKKDFPDPQMLIDIDRLLPFVDALRAAVDKVAATAAEAG